MWNLGLYLGPIITLFNMTHYCIHHCSVAQNSEFRAAYNSFLITQLTKISIFFKISHTYSTPLICKFAHSVPLDNEVYWALEFELIKYTPYLTPKGELVVVILILC